MSNKGNLIKDDSGRGLVMALCVLAVVTVLFSPLMASMRSSVATTGVTELTRRQHYAADSAVEYAIRELEQNANLRSQLLTNLGQSMALPFEREVNGIVPQVEVVALSADSGSSSSGGLLEWALWAHSITGGEVIKLTGSGHAVYGGVHSNDRIKVSGAGNTVHAPVEYVDCIGTTGAGNSSWISWANQVNAADAYPISWDLSEFSDPGIEGTWAYSANQDGEYHYYGSDYHVSGAGEVIPRGLYFVDGDIKISGSGVSGNGVTMVATGRIDLSGAGMDFSPYVSGLTFFANSNRLTGSGAFDVSGAGNAGGTVFAPNGRIKLSGAGNQITGAFIGQEINISGSGCRIYLAEIPLTEVTQCGVFDVRAIAGEEIVQARVSDCGEDGLQVMAWTMY